MLAKLKAVFSVPGNRGLKYGLLVILGVRFLDVVGPVKTLGVSFKEDPSGNDQIENVANETSKLSGVVNRLRYFLPRDIKLLV